MDLGAGFSVRAVSGRSDGLLANGHPDEHAHLAQRLRDEDPKIKDWARHLRGYIHSPDGVLLLHEL